MKRYHALLSIGGGFLFIFLPIGALVVSSLRSDPRVDLRRRAAAPPDHATAAAADKTAREALEKQLATMVSRLDALEGTVSRLVDAKRALASNEPHPLVFPPTSRLSDPGLILPSRDSANVPSPSSDINPTPARSGASVSSSSRGPNGETPDDPQSASSREQKGGTAANESPDYQVLRREFEQLKEQIKVLTVARQTAPTPAERAPAERTAVTTETSTQPAPAPEEVAARVVQEQPATRQPSPDSATDSATDKSPPGERGPAGLTVRTSKTRPNRGRNTKAAQGGASGDKPDAKTNARPDNDQASSPDGEADGNSSEPLSEKELARAAKSKLRQGRSTPGDQADAATDPATGVKAGGLVDEEEDQPFIQIEIGSPREGATVGRVERLYAYTNVPGWPVVLVSSSQDDDSWWAQPVVGRHAHQIGAKVHFGNDESFSGSSFRLVILLLDSEEEAVRFRTARQFKEIPRGIKRSREFRYVLR